MYSSDTENWTTRWRMPLPGRTFAVIVALLTLIGVLGFWPSSGAAQGEPCYFFGETQQVVCDLMLYRFRSEGVELDGLAGFTIAENVALFGEPISPAYQEGPFTIQQFTRSVFMYETARAPHAPVSVTFQDSAPPPPPPADNTIPLPPIPPVGPSETGETILFIQNAAPLDVRITMSGAQNRTVDLPPCATCPVYNAPIEACPADGPVERLVIAPGRYVIRIEFGQGIAPFQGETDFLDGFEYYYCSYLIQR